MVGGDVLLLICCYYCGYFYGGVTVAVLSTLMFWCHIVRPEQFSNSSNEFVFKCICKTD